MFAGVLYVNFLVTFPCKKSVQKVVFIKDSRVGLWVV